MLASRCRRLPGKCRLWCPAGWRLPTEDSGNDAAWLRRMASMAELFLFIRCGDRDAGGLHRELHLPRLGYVRRSTSCSSSWCASRSLWYCTWQLFVLLLVGFALDGLVLLASSWRRTSPTRSSLSSLAWSAVVACGELFGFYGNEKYMAVPLGARVQSDCGHCLELLRVWVSVPHSFLRIDPMIFPPQVLNLQRWTIICLTS